MKHLLSTCKIIQCDNKLVIQIILTLFEIHRTGYTASYFISLQSLYHLGWVCEATSARNHTSTHICAMHDIVCGDTVRNECSSFCCPNSWIVFNKIIYYCKCFIRPATLTRTKTCISETYYDNHQSVYLCPSPHSPLSNLII